MSHAPSALFVHPQAHTHGITSRQRSRRKIKEEKEKEKEEWSQGGR